MKPLLHKYPDTIELVKAKKDGYGSESIVERTTVKAAFVQTTGWQQGNFTNPITSDAIAYIDHNNPWVIENAYRLEEFKVVANLFGGSERLNWYKVTSSAVGKAPLSDNRIDNILLSLDKTTEVKS